MLHDKTYSTVYVCEYILKISCIIVKLDHIHEYSWLFLHRVYSKAALIAPKHG